MSKAGLSVFVWGLYLLVVGLSFLLIPNLLLPMIGLATTIEVWVRVIGVLIITLGAYDLLIARNNFTPMILATVPGRIFFGASLIMFYVIGYAGAGLVLFGGLEILGATLTWLGMQADQYGSHPASPTAPHPS